MSCWKTILEKDFKELNEINYAKLNCIQQKIAELFQYEELSILEVSLILEGMKNHELLNKENSKEFYKQKYGTLLKHEGMD